MTIGLTAQRMIDPIAALVNEARENAGAHPVALVAMDIGVTLTGGLAVVETKRSFRNDEKAAIEALLSLPVPVHAAFFGLTAKIDGRILKGIAQAREEARETYEEAVSEGKTAVLHEELLRGVHALSVGNLAPGGTIEVTTRWADTLRSAAASCGRLRIPMTVGDVYGIAPLPETDELTHGKGLKNVSLRIRHDAGAIRLATGALRASRDGVLAGEAPANAPIDIEVEGWKPGALKSKAWDGRNVSLHIDEVESGKEPVHAAVLVDHSGSMSFRCEGDSEQYVSTHEAVRSGLHALTEELRETDRLSLWEFDNTCNPVDRGLAASPGAFAKAIEKLTLPSLSEATARKLAVGESLVTHLTSLVLVDEEGPLQEGLPVTRKVDLPTPRTFGDVAYGLVAPNACHSIILPTDESDRDPILRSSLPPPDAICDLAPPSPDLPESEREEQCERQAENLYTVTHWIDWKKEGSALAACNLNGLEPAVAASIRALADRKDIRETAAEWGIDPVRLALALVAAWAAERAAGWDESTERHANRVRRSLLKGVDSDAFGAYFGQFDPEGE